jgi:hypothetical protein
MPLTRTTTDSNSLLQQADSVVAKTFVSTDTAGFPTGSISRTGSVSTNDSFNLKTISLTPTSDISSLTFVDYKILNAGVSDLGAIYVNSEGTRAFIVNRTSQTIEEYVLRVAFDISTLYISGKSISYNTWDTATNGVFFSPDGTKMYTCGSTAVVNGTYGILASEDRAYQLDLSVPFDVTTAVFNGKSIKFAAVDIGLAETAPRSIVFSPDGLNFYMVGSTQNRIFQYLLAIPYDLSTAVLVRNLPLNTLMAGVPLVPTFGRESVIYSIAFSSNGRKLYNIGNTGKDINEFNLSTSWDISTAVYNDKAYIGYEYNNINILRNSGTSTTFVTTPTMFLNSSDNSIFVVDNASNRYLYKYSLNNPGLKILPLTTNGRIDLVGNTRIKESSLFVDKNLFVENNFNAAGSVVLGSTTIGGSLSMGGNNISTVSLSSVYFLSLTSSNTTAFITGYDAQLTALPPNTTTIPIHLKMTSGQVADAMNILDTNNRRIFRINGTGQLQTGAPTRTITTKASDYSMTLSGATGNGTTITYTTSGSLQLEPGMLVTITGVTPTAYNITGTVVTAAAGGTTFTVTNAATGTYSSGGTVTVVQSADITQIQNSAGTVLGGNNAVGQLYNGSTTTILTAVGGATTSATGNGSVATIGTTNPHGLANGDLVTVAGITPTGYNGTFVITGVSSNAISYNNPTTAAQTVAGTISVPAQTSLISRSAGTVALSVRGASSQLSNLQEWKNSSGTTLSAVDSVGNFTKGDGDQLVLAFQVFG